MAGDLIEDKFKKWTGVKDLLAARIAVFENIRGIPYAIIPELRDPLTGPAGILKLNKGSCVPKHFLLGLLFNKMGIAVKYVSYLYDWDDKEIQYPQVLRELTKEMPITAHLACKAYINKKWVLVDATWDLPLRNYGFPVNEEWDGFSDCKNAVKPIKEIIHRTLEERVQYSDEHRKSYTEKEMKTYDIFTAQLNEWFAMIRSGIGA
ncbi:MAG: hypothetical protein NTZ63_00955 [Candidatus Omnitrophica bacterium]|nr:hypothetical protein [Candidatus Omnitrophota bacterium]